MSNPGVVTLTKTSVCWQELKIEDNLGEAIHIHYGQLRIDLTIEEFEELAIAAEKILDQMDELIPVDNVVWRDLNPIFLQNPKNTNILFRLKDAYITKIKLKDIYVDSYIHLPFIGNVFMYRSLKYSRVFKALHGYDKDNNKYEQLNELFMSNKQRVLQNLEYIQKNQYPVDNQYIILNKDNMIIDGQHRSACLSYIYGLDYEIPVMKWIFDDKNHSFFSPPKSLFNIIIQSYAGWIRNKVHDCIRLPIKCVWRIKKQMKRISNRSDVVRQDLMTASTPKSIEDVYSMLNCSNIQYIKLDLDIMTLDHSADIAVLVNSTCKSEFQNCMLQHGFIEDVACGIKYEYLYSLEKDCWYKNELFCVHVYYHLLCKSFFEQALLPLDQYIEKKAWETKKYNDENQCYQLSDEVSLIVYLIQCIYFEQTFTEENRKRLSKLIDQVADENLASMLKGVFFGFTRRMIYLLRNKCFDNIINEYRYYKEY